MGVTALQKHFRTARVVDYRGATTAAAFSDPQTELSALHAGCGVYDLGFRAKLALAGKDRTRWLNGMVSNNIRDLPSGRGVYAFILNPQGRILGDLNAYNRGDSLLVDTDRNQVEKVLGIFRKYIIMDKVEIDDLTEKLTALGVSGPKAREVLTAAGFELPEATPASSDGFEIREVKWRGVDCTLVSEGGQQSSYEIWLGPDQIKLLWDALVEAGATPVGAEALEVQRILSGVPLYGVDIGERELPQETEQARALSFTKGCYIGQEIVERIRSRGNVHRTFSGFALKDEATGPGQIVAGRIVAGTIAPGDKIIVDSKEVGEVTSVASLPGNHGEPNRTVALGYIRREVSAAGREVKIGTAAAKIVKLPFEEIGLALSVSR